MSDDARVLSREEEDGLRRIAGWWSLTIGDRTIRMDREILGTIKALRAERDAAQERARRLEWLRREWKALAKSTQRALVDAENERDGLRELCREAKQVIHEAARLYQERTPTLDRLHEVEQKLEALDAE